MKRITLGTTGITVPQNAFGALPVQRVDMEMASLILRRAYEGGMTFFDTARAYSDSEQKIGKALGEVRDKIFLASKTMARTPEAFWCDLEESLRMLQTDYIDIYQFHCVDTCYRPGDGTGMYECMQKAKEQGKILHIGVTSHKLEVARECVKSGLYETMQYPLSYLSIDKELELVDMCKEQKMGFIAMKGLAGGLINNSRAAFAFMSQFDHVLPIWGIQKLEELEEWLGYMEHPPVLDEEITVFIEKEKLELTGDFCRGCGYCLPCPAEIPINNCARMSQMIRRAPSADWLSSQWQDNMKKIENCLNCGECKKRCPYELNTPELLKKNYEDYKKILAGEVDV
ncbi:aldo/keto reductase [Faecalicatena orotica]|uniref:Putative aldo/keto reductase-like oxidoreductase n=1 Tax=Faecalicatena orotica TaxID=1544 RepID=A0A2Y9BP41_9FIRM|nr:aldo/keto reductase [Faecalicatena orotica]PWJ22894.1 putative aldo/keto reductase-like oxidoreductase [Faecalicatena orotica]SSA58029.1 Predicted oxidoreductase of the aldo/keto reductase family [Faecalicatena orotica]